MEEATEIQQLDDNQAFRDLWETMVERDNDGHKDIIFFYFGASWCGPCHSIRPKALSFMKKLIEEKKAKCYEIDVDKCDVARGWCNIQAIPSIVKFRGKKKMNTWTGRNLEVFLEGQLGEGNN
jgi:thiol-disulfide isomerase/thioredoxin